MGLLFEKQVSTAPSIENEMPEIKEAVNVKTSTASAVKADNNDWDELSDVFDGEKEIVRADDKLDAVKDFEDETM